MSEIMIDFINDSITEIQSKFQTLQRKFFEPYSIRLTTETNKYVFISDYLNEYNSILFGNNVILDGLKVTLESIDLTDNYAIFKVTKGVLISDKVLIEFTQDFQIKQSLNALNLTEEQYNVVYVKFKYSKSYPTNVAIVNVVSQQVLENTETSEVVNGILSAFKLNSDGNITVQYPNSDNYNLPDDLEIFGQPVSQTTTILNNNINFEEIIQRPTITEFTDNTLHSTPFKVNYEGINATHIASDWEVATSPNFNNIIATSYNDTVNLTSWVPQISNTGTFYARVRYKSEVFVSKWSDPFSFEFTSVIVVPTINTNDVGTLYPTFTLTEFQAIGYTDNWSQTVWEIATDPNFQNIVFNYTETNQANYDKLIINIDILEPLTTYYIRAKYIGDQGHESNWSPTLTYTTDKYILDPITIANEYVENSSVIKTITHDSGRTFNTTKYKLIVNVDIGTVDINGFTFTWNIPDVDQDTIANIEIKVVDKNDNTKVVSTTFTKQVTITNIPLAADNAIIITDFSGYQYNDGWQI